MTSKHTSDITRPAYFMSDLHLFTARSWALDHMSVIRECVRSASVIVLGGDIFDFRWSTLGSVEKTVVAAVGWLESLMAVNPACEFHFVIGNHDSMPSLVTELDSLTRTHPQFHCHDHFLRIGDTLFLHGDVANPKMTQERLVTWRQNFHSVKQHGWAMNTLYGVAISLRLHLVVAYMTYPHAIVARRIMRYLEGIGHGPTTGVQNVYFGHTHLHVSGYEHGGMKFHNGGAPIHGVPFAILPVDLS